MISRIFVRRLTNYYKLFPKTFPNGPPPSGPFAVDTRALRREYLDRQQQVHPDTSQGDNNSFSLDSAEVGNAYRTLCDPLKRAEHVLELNGVESLQEGATLTDEELLMDIMMIREELSECEDPVRRKELEKENDERAAATVKALEQAFAENNLEAAKKAAVELSYWAKIKENFQE